MASLMSRNLMARSAGLYPPMGGSARAPGRRKRKIKPAARKTSKRKATKSKGRARLVKGSAAAKAYMAKIRRKRRK